jgi:CHASE2 domain-containing sensor protein
VPHLGKRGRVLLFFGALDLVYAVSLAAPDARTRSAPLFVWLTHIAPLSVWAATWGVVGVLCLWQAWCRRDQIGYAAAIALKIAWGIVCLGGFLFGGIERGYVSAAIFLGFAYVIAVISGWAEPGDRKGPTWIPPSSSR